MTDTVDTDDKTRRDFLLLSTMAVGAVGSGLAAWPFIDVMNPAADTLALSTTEVDLAPIEEGMSITVVWRGKPVFIRRRTEEEIAKARDVEMSELPDPGAENANIAAGAPATDENRAMAGKEDWLVMMGVCTHLGCVPLGDAGDFGGWFCPCHGSHYDTAGRIRKGPAPRNLPVPIAEFVDETTIKLG